MVKKVFFTFKFTSHSKNTNTFLAIVIFALKNIYKINYFEILNVEYILFNKICDYLKKLWFFLLYLTKNKS